jgi:hypothetical protein
MDPLNLLEVNAAELDGLEAGPDELIVVAATWGRGCSPELLRRLEPFRRRSGYNGTLVAVVPRSQAGEVLGQDAPEHRPGQVPILSLAFGRRHLDWRPGLPPG